MALRKQDSVHQAKPTPPAPACSAPAKELLGQVERRRHRIQNAALLGWRFVCPQDRLGYKIAVARHSGSPLAHFACANPRKYLKRAPVKIYQA